MCGIRLILDHQTDSWAHINTTGLNTEIILT